MKSTGTSESAKSMEEKNLYPVLTTGKTRYHVSRKLLSLADFIQEFYSK